MNIPTLTLTGIDERTDVDWCDRMLGQRPHLELGLLLSLTPEGRPRYPCLDFISEMLDGAPGRCAIHICGRPARAALLDGALDQLVDNASRIQVNGDLSLLELRRCAERVQGKPLITQYTDQTDVTIRDAAIPNHQLLVDGSGGRGRSPAGWTRPATAKVVGFAGGLGPDNLSAELVKIAAVAQGRWWIDMENKLRDLEDWFDVGRACVVLSEFEDGILRAIQQASVMSSTAQMVKAGDQAQRALAI